MSVTYPPQLHCQVQVIEQDAGVYMVGQPDGNYLQLGENEYRVLLLLEGRTLVQVSEVFQAKYGGTLRVATLIQFVTKLHDAGLLEGCEQQKKTREIVFFDGRDLFVKLASRLPWIWTPTFVGITIILTFLTLFGDWNEFGIQSQRLLSEHFGYVLLASIPVVFSHEFAHALTCAAFGGKATKVGFTLINGWIPAFFVNVTGIYLIPSRSRRLWVIAAGVYWQMLVGIICFLAWSILSPGWLSNLTLFVCIGSFLNLFFNVNPLIKLDGYYFLAQWLRKPNLAQDSKELWLHRKGTKSWANILHFPLSVIYTATFLSLTFFYVYDRLTFQFHLFGLFASVLLASLLLRIPMKKKWMFLLPLILFVPWKATVGAYGILAGVQETILSTPDTGVLVLKVVPGQMVKKGEVVAEITGNENAILAMTAQSESATVHAELVRLEGEQRQQQESLAQKQTAASQALRHKTQLTAERVGVRRGLLPPRLQTLRSQWQALKAQSNEAQTATARAAKLLTEGLLSKSEGEQSNARFQKLEAETQAAKQRLEQEEAQHSIETDDAEDVLRVAQSRLIEAEESLKSITRQIATTNQQLKILTEKSASLAQKPITVTAAHDGEVVGDELLKSNQSLLAKGTKIATLVNRSTIKARLQVNEREIADVKIGQAVKIKALAMPGLVFTGTVLRQSNEVLQNTIVVEALLNDTALQPGMTVFGRIEYGWYPLGWILWHKLRQLLKVEIL